MPGTQHSMDVSGGGDGGGYGGGDSEECLDRLGQ